MYNKARKNMASDEKKTLFIGLGNPGEKYSGTYHNVGWETLRYFQEKLEERHGTGAAMEKGKDFHFQRYGDICLVYPDTFMNRSGEAIEHALAWFGKRPADAVVFHDDSDLAIGEYREATGGAAGHHGVESIFNSIGDAPILRVRIGVRDPLEKSGEQPRRKAGDFVLKKMRAEDMEALRTNVFEKLAARFLDGPTS